MKFLSTVMLSSCTLAASAVTTVSAPSVAYDGTTRLVTIGYDLSGDESIVTINLMTNGAPVTGDALLTLNGGINRKLSEGHHEVRWLPTDEALNRVVAAGALTAELKVWTTATPPPYMTADLVVTNVVRYYESIETLPGGLSSAIYRTEKLLMRHVPAKNVIWRMGAYGNESGQSTTSTDYYLAEIPHYVKLTADYYMGVFPLTQGQGVLIAALNAGIKKDYSLKNSKWESVPQNNVSYNSFRGSTKVWPQDGHDIAPDSYLARIRAVTGLDFDLPTEAQWEFACRAGTSTPLNNGKGASSIDEVGWTRDNAFKEPNEVGQLRPNSFGLYDMHGSVFEFCLDRYSTGDAYLATFGEGFNIMEDVCVDPEGPTTGSDRVSRGGSWLHYASTLGRSASRAYSGTSSAASSWGYRLVCPVIP